MATVAGPVKQSPSAKYDAIVEAQLERARNRIRTLDLTTALLGFVAATLAYGAVMALLDNWLTLPPAALYGGFFVYLAAALAYSAFTVVRPLTRNINPYFAARQVELTLPGAKNSVVNWLDLHDEPLPAAVQSALSQKAAKDLAKADLEKAVSGRRAGWTGGLVAGLVLFLLILIFSFGGGKLFKHLGRAFLPFAGAAPPTKTQLILLEPEEGDITVTDKDPVTIRVRVDGKVPEELKLLTQPTLADPEQERWLEAEGNNEWAITVPPFQVKQGFYYRVVGGDATTDVYRVDVRTTPMIYLDRFTATYRQPAYVGNKVERIQRRDRELKDYRGTKVELYVPTNRKLKEGKLDLFAKDGQKFTYKATIVAGDEKAMRISLPLLQSGSYSIRFTSAENERLSEYSDSLPFSVTVFDDLPPDVKLFKPGKDESLPADATLSLVGVASDDIGVKELTLRMKLNADPIASRPYRSEKEIRLADGGYPHVLEYKASVDFAGLKDAKDKPLVLLPGAVLEYWLEARDACDDPKQNIAESTHYKVTIEAPRRDEQAKKEERQQAEAEQKEHEKKQDEKLNKENQDRRKQEQKQQEENKGKKDEGENNDGNSGEKPKQGDGNPPKDKRGSEQSNDTKEPKNNEGAKKPGEQDNAKKPKTPEEQKKEDEARKNSERIKEAAERARREGERSKAKPDEKPQQGSGKPDQSKEGEGSKENTDKKSPNGEGKESPERKPQDGKDTAKDGGQEGNASKSGKAKDRGGPEQNAQPQAESKDNAGAKKGDNQTHAKDNGHRPEQKQDSRSEAKAAPENKPKDGEAQGKGGEKQANKPEKSAGKDKGDGKQSGNEAASKGGEADMQDAKQAAGKDGKQAKRRGDGKGAGQGNDPQKEKTAQDKGAGGDPMTGQGERSQAKGPPKPEDSKGQTEAKGAPQQPSRGQGKQKSQDQATAGGAKSAPKQGEPQAGDKPAGQGGEKPKDASTAKGDRVQGDGLKKPTEEMRRDDVEDIAEELKSNDPQRREQARSKLEDVHRQTQDGDARQAAEDALKKDDERRQNQRSASAKPAPSDRKDAKDGKPSQCAECKGGEQKGDGKRAAGKDGGTKEGPAKAQPKDGAPKGNGKDVVKNPDDDKEPPNDKGLKKWLDQTAKGMKQKDGGRKPTDEEAAEKLAQTMKDLAGDNPKRREQAQEFLKKLDQNLKDQQQRGDPDPPKGPPDKPVPEKVKKELEKLAKDLKGNDPKRREKAEEALKQLSQFARGDTRSGGTAPQTEVPGDLPGSASDGRHRNQAGDLQLHKLDPKELREYGKKAGLTPAQIDEAVKYDRKLAAEKPDKSPTTTGSGKALPTTEATRVRPSDDNGPKVDPTNEGQPPVELRPAAKDLAKRLSELKQGSKDK